MIRFAKRCIDEIVEYIYGESGCPLCPIIGLFTAVVVIVTGFVLSMYSAYGDLIPMYGMHGRFLFAIGVGAVAILAAIMCCGHFKKRNLNTRNSGDGTTQSSTSTTPIQTSDINTGGETVPQVTSVATTSGYGAIQATTATATTLPTQQPPNQSQSEESSLLPPN